MIHDVTAGCLEDCGDLHSGAAWHAFLLSFFCCLDGRINWIPTRAGKLDPMHNTRTKECLDFMTGWQAFVVQIGEDGGQDLMIRVTNDDQKYLYSTLFPFLGFAL
jgi:hypothetical protein